MSSEQKHWAELGEVGAYWGIIFMFFIYKWLGRWVFKLVLFPVTAYFWLRYPDKRAASIDFLNNVWKCPDNTLVKKPTLLTSMYHFFYFGDAIIDKLGAWSGKIPESALNFPDEKLWLDLKETGRGAVVITSHLGNVDMCRAFAHALTGSKLTVLVHTHHAGKFNRVLEKINPRSGFELLQVSEISPLTGMQLKERVEAGELIVIAGDRTSQQHSSKVQKLSFLNKPAYFSEGPFILASILDCPVYLLFGFKRADNDYTVIFEHFSNSLKMKRQGRQEQLTKIMQQYADRLAYYAVRWPLQWYNFFDFWQKPKVVINETKNKKPNL